MVSNIPLPIIPLPNLAGNKADGERAGSAKSKGRHYCSFVPENGEDPLLSVRRAVRF
jgi:hypothetical protein